MRRIFIIISLTFLFSLAAGILYLYSRSFDYQAHFMVRSTPDVVFHNIYYWNLWNRNQVQGKIEILDKIPVSIITQKVLLSDTTLIFSWEFKKINDSATMVRVKVSDPERKFYNRLTIPFKNTRLKKSVRGNLLDIKTRLELMLKTFRFEYSGFHRFENKSCVYVSLKSAVRDKARTMMANVVELNQFVRQNYLELNGDPFLVITDWNVLSDSICYDFCFPITNSEVVPEHPKIKFMRVEGMEAVKTDFFGNYGNTDIAWYNLVEESKLSGYLSNNKLVEVFLNDPHAGGNELEWKAEIFLGIESVK